MYKKILPLLALIPMIANAEQNTNTTYPEMIKGFHIVNKDVKKTRTLSATELNGYKETHEQDQLIQFFSHLKSNAPQEIKEFKNSNNSGDTHLKSSFSEIKLSIPFTKINGINDNEIIGYAPIGSYEDGWTGIRVFFEKKSMGICSYSFERFTGINADYSAISYVVNKEPSFTAIEGNYNTGFVYIVSWDDDNKTNVYDHKLECVNKNMNNGIIDKMVVLANQIDKA